MEKEFDLVILGGGPAGYVAAIRGVQLGATVCLVEKENLGGTCLNVGCIPTKVLHKSAQVYREVMEAHSFGVEVGECKINMGKIIDRKAMVVNGLVDGVNFLLERNGVQVISGEGRFVNSTTIEVVGTGRRIKGGRVVIATGSKNAVPPIPGINGSGVMDSSQALELTELPNRLAVIGGGVIGSEFASIFRALGSKVTVIEMLPHLITDCDLECSLALQQHMARQGISLHLQSKVLEITDSGAGQKRVAYQNGDKIREVSAEKVLYAVGRRPNTASLGLETAGIREEKGWILVDEHLQTSVDGVYAAGDVTGKNLLAHVAYEEAITAVENALGSSRSVDYRSVPKTVFTFPEVGYVGLTEQEAVKRGYDVITGKFSLRGNGKAKVLGEYDGFVKVVADKKFREILGVHIIGPQATELIAEATLAVSMQATLDDMADVIHAHPSVAEAIKEAALAALGRALHG